LWRIILSVDLKLSQMSETTIARRLAAILAADVVAYSRLMGADEDATMAQWWEYRREVIDPGIEKSGGRIVKHTGDGFLAEFASAFDAVKCALALQAEINERSEKVAQDKRVQFRMGVNLGDIMSDDEDIYGDGVNIAARIEALAEPGRVFVSGSIYEQIRSKPDFECTSKGEHALKNIAEPMRVFDVCVAGQAPGAENKPAAAAAAQAPDLTGEEKPSIAVLPFDNMSGDEEQEYFADGITEDLITDLSKISGLLVIARNSVFTYKGKAVNVPDVCRELGVRWALEGSVRKSGNRVRVTAQLIDGGTGGHLWADRFDRNLDDIFAVQDEVTAEIVGALKVKLSAEDEARVGRRGTQDVEAYDSMLQARELIISGTEGNMIQARILIQRGLDQDPDFAAAMGGMTMTFIMQYANQWGENHRGALEEAERWAKKAVATDPNEALSWMALGLVRIWQNRHDDAREAVKKQLELVPSSTDALRMLASIENFAGNYQTSIDAYNEFIKLDPHGPTMALHTAGLAHFALGHWDVAAEYFSQRIAAEPDTDSSYVFLAGTLGHLGQADEAKENWQKVFTVKPDYSLAERSRLWPYKDTKVVDNLYAGLEKAGIDPGSR
jgi:adenylate cyclase